MSVVAVTVTYGDRGNLCTATLEAAQRNGVVDFIVVLNGASIRSRSLIRSWVTSSAVGRVEFVEHDANRGSAEGFGAGLARARTSAHEWVWLLDDDNVPEAGALSLAMAVLEIEGKQGVTVAGVCMRDTDETHAALLSGQAVRHAFPPAGSFFGVDVFRRASGFFRIGPALRSAEDILPQRLPQAPYGGLVLPRSALERCGGPRPDLVLYFDDVEYTRRLVDCGVRLVFCAESKVHEVGSKWAASGPSVSYMRSMIHSGSAAKIFYSFRNCAFVDWQLADSVPRKIRFLINVAVYSADFAVTAGWRHRRMIRLYIRAVSMGVRGRLGTAGLVLH